jgi:hypothetical protein
MSDAVVASAINDWPRSIVELDGEKFIRILKARRDQLPVIAEQFYELTADVVDFVGSHKHERFEVTRKNDSETEVVVYKTTKKGEIRLERYRRTIYHHETREIRLYGLAGNDQFRVDGEVGHGIKVVAVGGTGDDTFVDTSKVVGSRKNTHFYDTSDMNSFEAGPETRVHQSDDPLINEYNPGGYAPNAKFPRAYFGSNKDDGIFIGGGLLFTRHGFRKAPHSSTHLVQGNVAFKTRAFNVRYDVDIVDLFGSWDLDLTSYYLSPDNIRNFYGLGNETNTEVSDRRFYQARLTEFLVSPSFRQNYEPGITLTLGPKIKFTRVIQDNERFVGTPQAGITDNTFDNQWYAGLTSSFTLDNADRGVNPTQGLIWQNEADMSIGVNNDDVYTTLASDISIFASPSVSPQITFAGRIGASHIFGQFPFFDAVTLGGKSNLRGFRSTRYTGRSNVYNNLELRVSLFHFSSYTAVGDFGLLGFHDLGRVWTDKEDSNVWHQGYGGGFWATFFDAMAMTAVMGFSDDDTTFTLKFGFLF